MCGRPSELRLKDLSDRKRHRSRERSPSRSRESSRRHRDLLHNEDRHDDYFQERNREHERHRDRERDRHHWERWEEALFLTSGLSINWAWWLMPVIPALVRSRQVDCLKLKGSLDYKVRPFLKTKRKVCNRDVPPSPEFLIEFLINENHCYYYYYILIPVFIKQY